MAQDLNPLVFVYGTLRRSAQSSMSMFLAARSTFISEATFQGLMYLVDYYPGVIPSRNPHDMVKGEVVKLDHPLQTLFRLDQYEGCSLDDPKPHEYLRSQQQVTLANGQLCVAWLYLYQSSVTQLPPISQGDFLNRE